MLIARGDAGQERPRQLESVGQAADRCFDTGDVRRKRWRTKGCFGDGASRVFMLSRREDKS